jgi:pre-mRNA-splicing factor CWC22
VPPFRLAQQLAEAADKEGPQYQRLTWDALRKSINGLVNKARVSRSAACFAQ